MTAVIARLTFVALAVILLLQASVPSVSGATDTANSQSPPTPTWTMARADAGASGFVSQTLPSGLQVLWEAQTPEAIETTPVSDGIRLYVTDVMGGVEALDVETGKSIWRREIETGFVAPAGLYLPSSVIPTEGIDTAPIPIIESAKAAQPDQSVNAAEPSGSPPRFQQPLLVVGDVEGNVEAMNPETGASLWKYTTEGEINAAPAFFAVPQTADDGSKAFEIRLLQTSQDGSLYCLNAHTGQLDWKYETDDQIRCAASIGSGKTFLGGCDGALHVVDLATGEAARESMPLGGPTGSTPAVIGDEVFLPIMDGVLFAFNPSTGEVRWKFEDPERAQEYRSSVAIGPDRVIVASNNKHIDAINRKTGERMWRKTLRRRADASPLIAGDDVWIASTDGLLLRLSLADGEETWSYESRGKFIAAPAILGDRLFIADDDGVVRCFGVR
ncbi:outer membrane protein assembly factor BamB family protein [Aporhodopirellula aestuarii]|uniref:PQQ-binding-like beta-propeller repeat protein n=1 Tax=Aporhodopirellula aestuarii TaxID=2950107 RepID=A0ABT0U6L9_9BACT|nr:PQQ-binding-like beta-propeller repeat protein [Aporhodopirellula aestuarii]MCM2372597.1 PQQ-binding-like beta-propeller repeat protein [Aporhodopirellula aestuarii]